MRKRFLVEVAKRYVAIIEAIEKTRDQERLVMLEEERVIWHNRFIEMLKRYGILFKDRDHVTQIAYRIAEGDE